MTATTGSSVCLERDRLDRGGSFDWNLHSPVKMLLHPPQLELKIRRAQKIILWSEESKTKPWGMSVKEPDIPAYSCTTTVQAKLLMSLLSSRCWFSFLSVFLLLFCLLLLLFNGCVWSGHGHLNSSWCICLSLPLSAAFKRTSACHLTPDCCTTLLGVLVRPPYLCLIT